MILTITYMELKSPWKFFLLSKTALGIIRQLKTTNCVEQKTKGIWTKHYTMTLWNTEEEMKAFARSGAHKHAMQRSGDMAKEIRIYTTQTDSIPPWKEAKKLVMEGKVFTF